jgi:hypothetical protein
MPVDDNPYGAPQPEEQVTGVVPDPADPSMAVVSFTSGRTATMRTSEAEALPQQPPIPPLGAPAVAGPPMGPPPAPDYAASTAAGVAQGSVLSPEEQKSRDAFVAGGGLNFGDHPTTAPDNLGGTVPVGVDVGTGAPRHDPNSDIVSEGEGPGFAPFSQTESNGVSTSDTVDDPGLMQSRVDDAYNASADAAHQADETAYQSRMRAMDTELAARAKQEQEAQTLLKQKELEQKEHERIYKAIDATPIDEDQFWGEGDSRRAGAWIALALSGFLQGATRGQNPALNQMVQALDKAQDRWLQNQQNARAGQLRTRERLMGSAENAVSSLKLQLSGLMEKRITLEAQKAGLPPPPALSTYIASQGVKRAEEKNAIGSRVSQTASQQAQTEARATAGTGPLRRGDLVLKHLGIDPKAHADAMDPKGLNLGGVVAGAKRLQDISTALDAIAAKNGGELPAQGTASWSQLGLAPLAARLGIKNAAEQVNTRQLLEEAKLAFKQTVNIKSIDSENEGKNFNKIMDSGEGQTTIGAVRQKAAEANQNAIGIASGVTRDPQGYLDFVRSTQNNNVGISNEGRKPRFSPAPGGADGPDLTAAGETQTGGGPAQSAPLGTSPGEKALATSTTAFGRGTYQRLRGSKPGVPH